MFTRMTIIRLTRRGSVGYRVHSIGYRVLCTEYWVQMFMREATSTSSWSRVQGSGYTLQDSLSIVERYKDADELEDLRSFFIRMLSVSVNGSLQRLMVKELNHMEENLVKELSQTKCLVLVYALDNRQSFSKSRVRSVSIYS